MQKFRNKFRKIRKCNVEKSHSQAASRFRRVVKKMKQNFDYYTE